MKKKILVLGMVVALVAAMVMPMAVMAGNEGTQSASTSSAVTIEIVRVSDGTTAVTTITFPVGAPSAVIVNPTNSASETQILTATDTEATPVAQLKSAVAYTLWYTVTDTGTWAATVASEEIYTMAIDGTLTAAAFAGSANSISSWGTPTATLQALDGTLNKELYLGVTLGADAGKSGTSTLTVLGETP